MGYSTFVEGEGGCILRSANATVGDLNLNVVGGQGSWVVGPFLEHALAAGEGSPSCEGCGRVLGGGGGCTSDGCFVEC